MSTLEIVFLCWSLAASTGWLLTWYRNRMIQRSAEKWSRFYAEQVRDSITRHGQTDTFIMMAAFTALAFTAYRYRAQIRTALGSAKK